MPDITDSIRVLRELAVGEIRFHKLESVSGYPNTLLQYIKHVTMVYRVKATDKSRRTRNDPFPLPIVVTISLYIRSNAVSVL